jgi:hypothetical protein
MVVPHALMTTNQKERDMKIIEVDLQGYDPLGNDHDLPKKIRGGAYIDMLHSTPEEIMEEIDKLIRPHGLQIVLGDVGQGDGYLVKVEKLK